MSQISDCCGAYPKGLSEEMGLCPDCHDHCEYVDEDEEEYIDIPGTMADNAYDLAVDERMGI